MPEFCAHLVHGCIAISGCTILQDVDGKMQQELDSNVSQCMLDIQSVIAPIQQLTAAEQQRLETALSRLEELRLGIEDLKQKAANVE